MWSHSTIFHLEVRKLFYSLGDLYGLREFHKLAISWLAVRVVFVSYRCLLFIIISSIFCMSVKLAVAIYIR